MEASPPKNDEKKRPFASHKLSFCAMQLVFHFLPVEDILQPCSLVSSWWNRVTSCALLWESLFFRDSPEAMHRALLDVIDSPSSDPVLAEAVGILSEHATVDSRCDAVQWAAIHPRRLLSTSAATTLPEAIKRSDLLGFSAALLREKRQGTLPAALCETFEDPDYGKVQALHYAVKCNSINIVRFVISLGAPIDAETSLHLTALFIAAAHGFDAIAEVLLEGGASVTHATTDGVTALQGAVLNSRFSSSRLLLDQGADVNGKTSLSLLHSAAATGDCQVTQLLLDRGAPVNAANSDGCTPLHYAAEKGHFQVSQLLLDRGALVNTASVGGLTPLHFAARCGSLDIVRLFVDRGSNIHARDLRMTWFYNIPANLDPFGFVYYLYLCQGTSSEETHEGWTAMHHAAWGGHSSVVLFLLQQGAHKNVLDTAGDSPLSIAVKFERVEIVHLLNAAPATEDTSLILRC